GTPIVCQVARDNEYVRFTAYPVQLVMQWAQSLRGEMQIGGGCDSHEELPGRFSFGPSPDPAACLRNLRSRNPFCRSSNPRSLISTENMFSSSRLPRNAALELCSRISSE